VSGLGWVPLGQPQQDVQVIVTPASRIWKLPHFHCTADQLKKVGEVLGGPVSREEIRTILLGAADKGKRLAEDGWLKVQGTKTLSAGDEALFKACFGVASTARPTSTGTMRRIVQARFRGGIQILGDDAVKVSCWGWPWGGASSKDEPENHFARVLPRRWGIGLGKKFWAVVRDGDTVSMAAVMLGAALRIFYYRMAFGERTPRTVRSLCYLRFAILAGGQTVPAWLESRCTPA
jgi:hypothetical protein